MSDFWRGKRVLVTGHTGFKGSWLALWLASLGAEVYGWALEPDTDPALFDQLRLARDLDHAIGDIRDAGLTADRVRQADPDVVLHLAAQPLVRRSYREPLLTWQTNVIGTASLLDALRGREKRCAVVIVTTDKVYENREWLYGYRECDPLGGHDPYSASKAAAELAVATWRNAFFPAGSAVRVASARAGNVIGGGDWAEDRLVPDIARALAAGRPVSIRNPASVRPWQHVLESLSGYLLLARRLYEENDAAFASAFNFGPEPSDVCDVRAVMQEALRHWPGDWQDASEDGAVHEAGLLGLSIEKARAVLGWTPRWSVAEAVEKTIRWYRAVHDGADARALTLSQIEAYANG
ncbi:CDP-glucose 4,6-dehydratase [uncultured Pleomorphomonas sp.]|uniref:CDP-glucose 4,6-dehydratase n=1 Tax=uncultured Pleomorphomonas sp. TaxID=442121 RepID=A0A212LPB3_9HYPH|nr:CDP-glucose 4,6-dehydratase [uncultured Pleomorphomonas sp.]SCM79279.1 CDP-glucose 4,6-dehydratase [uncultured Pleomorphomonas sp.]